jgi:outer membrane biosynthesis protein TonB
MRFSSVGRISTLLLALGCAHSGATPAFEQEASVRIAKPLARGDCVEARRRAALEPDLPVDRVPAPLAMKPPPFRGYPASALRKDGSAEIRIDVLVDTMGRAEMKTFKVVKVSHPWFTQNVRGVIGKWRFTPAQLAGCKVPRVYHFMSSLAGSGSADR